MGQVEIDPFVQFLQTHPHIAAWLEQQAMHGRSTNYAPRARAMPPPQLCVTTEIGEPVFTMPVALDALPSDDELHRTLADYNLCPKLPKAKNMIVPARVSESLSAFYLPQEVTLDGWALGHIITTPQVTAVIAAVLGVEPTDEMGTLEGAWFMSSKHTGDSFEVMLTRDGHLFVSNDVELNYRRTLRMYAPPASSDDAFAGGLGQLVRVMVTYSMQDCIECGGWRAQSGGYAERFCRCLRPSFPALKRPLDSWVEVSNMTCRLVQDALQLQKLYDGSGKFLSSAILYQPQSIMPASQEALPLFQALVLDNPSFKPGVEAPLFTDELARALPPPQSTKDEPESFHSKTTSSSGRSLSEQCADKDDRTGRFECGKCGKRFSTRKSMNRHLKTVHEEQRKFQCEECPQQFKLRNHLTVHIRQVHQAERQRQCHLCPKQFWSSSNLKRHIDEAHLKTRAHTCAQCAKCFSSRFNLNRHIASFHNNSIVSSPTPPSFNDGSDHVESLNTNHGAVWGSGEFES